MLITDKRGGILGPFLRCALMKFRMGIVYLVLIFLYVVICLDHKEHLFIEQIVIEYLPTSYQALFSGFQ